MQCLNLVKVSWSNFTSDDGFNLLACCNLSVIRKKANLKTGVSKKQSTPNSPKNEHFFTSWYAHSPYSARMRENIDRAYQGIRKVLFSETLACFVFLKYPFWDSPFCLITGELGFNVKFSIFDNNVLQIIIL